MTTASHNKEKYRIHCATEDTICIFAQDWWLDTTCGADNWDVSIVESNNKIIAALPYQIKKHKNGITIGQPQLTQNLGPWLAQDDAKYTNQLSNQKKYMTALIDALPPYKTFAQNFNPKITNWLPFYWMGFKQQTNYTYRIEDLTNTDALWDNIRSNIKRAIRKAEKNSITINQTADLEDFITLIEKTFNRQGKSLPYPKELVRNIFAETQNRNASQLFIAQDTDGNHHAGALIIWDNQTAYYLIGGGDPDLRNSGAASLILWEAIKFSASVTQSFDFEGSMIDPIERFFRSFGATQTPYFNITKNNCRKKLIKDFIKNFKNL